jgi:eukaryotic-like serine/threonine-protein kinase
MPIPSTPSEFLELVARSELLEQQRVQLFAEQCGRQGLRFESVRECAEALVAAELLTIFQAKLLLAGKWKNFFLGGKYKVLDHLGAGGMGTVLLCEHRHMRRRVAVKILPPDKTQTPGSLQRFVREAQAIARLDHPNIVRAHDIDCDSGIYFLVMEYVDGASLHHLLQTRSALSSARAVNYVCQAAAGLQHAHQAGLVHRDIKPSNLLLDRMGAVKILDLGLARFSQSDEQLTQMLDSKTVLGTADYLAPEQARDSNVDIRADIYSLGALFYFLLLGRPPFEAGNIAQKLIAHQTTVPPSVCTYRNDVPAGVGAVIAAMLAKDRARRPQTPNDVIVRLQPWLEEVPPPTPEEMPEHRFTQHRDLDTMSRLSTIATMSSSVRSKIMKAAASAGATQH